jgi:hypothetical protein
MTVLIGLSHIVRVPRKGFRPDAPQAGAVEITTVQHGFDLLRKLAEQQSENMAARVQREVGPQESAAG